MQIGVHRPARLPAALAMVLGAGAVGAVETPVHASPVTYEKVNHADYTTAALFTPSRLRKMVGSINVAPKWLRHSDRFWYEYYTPDGKFYYLVDPARGKKAPLFDQDYIASQLALTMREAFNAKNLPLENIQFVEQDRVVRFEVKSSRIDKDEKKRGEEKAKAKEQEREKEGKKKKKKDDDEAKKKDYKKIYTFDYDLATGKLKHRVGFKKPNDDPSWANISPDEEKVAYAKGYDLYWMDRANLEKAKEDEEDKTIIEHRLTDNGEAFYDYQGTAFFSTVKSSDDPDELAENRVRASVVWSRDSTKFALVRKDRRKTGKLWVIDSLAKPRPTLKTYSYPMPGDENVDRYELWLFDFTSRQMKQIEIHAFEDQFIYLLDQATPKRNANDDRKPSVWLTDRSDKVYVYRASRDLKRVDFLEVDVDSGQSRVLIEERFNTPNDQTFMRKVPWMVSGGEEIIFWSERDGWAHFYLYDNQGKVKNAITRGNYHVDNVEGVDEKNRVMYFTAHGRERGENPYYKHLYKVNLDGSDLQLLSGANFDHTPEMSDSTQYYVDNYSRVDTAPVSEVRDRDGKLIVKLEETDLTQLQSAGYKFPERFSVKADDGMTDLYGVMYKPFIFDPTKKYPIIAFVYPGPVTELVDTTFGITRDGADYMPAMHLPMLAQFGYIVITVGNRGGHRDRSRAYQDFSYQSSIRDYGLADKKATIEQLATRFGFVDVDRVGIFGHSGGGLMSTAAMLVYPDFFKVAVSVAGDHENSIYNMWFSERFNGVEEVTDDEGNVSFKSSVTENSALAKNLEGHLMLVTGLLDSNVHPAHTFRVVEALIKAGKRFDLLVVPSGGHVFRGLTGEYLLWARADYFNKYLLGDSPDGVDMIHVIRNHPATQ